MIGDQLCNCKDIMDLIQVLAIWEALQNIQFTPEIEDKWIWQWEPKGVFTTRSA
jgi:hypothetical protein